MTARRRTRIMGVLNVTPDSFSDGGRFVDPDSAVRRALRMAAEGADIIDVGGESSRPGAPTVGEQEELDRVAPVVERIAARTDVPISIDTMKAAVAATCLGLGATIVNDITGLEDPEMIRAAKEAGAGVVVMHMRGRPATMQKDLTYGDLIAEIVSFLAQRAERAHAAGITDIVVDPGIGFGKTAGHNFEILRRLGEVADLGYPVMIGPSRKSFLGSLPSALPTEERLEGTLAAVALGVAHGASIVRVHDVKEARRVTDVVDAVMRT